MSADLGEVFAALDGLQAYDDKLVTGSDVASAAQRLIQSEVSVGGPYYSSGYSSGNRLSPVANACVAQCLIWLAAPLPKLMEYLTQNVADLRIESSDYILTSIIAAHQTGFLYDKEYDYVQQYMHLLRAALGSEIQVCYWQHQLDPVPNVPLPIKADIYPNIYHKYLEQTPLSQTPFGINTRAMLEQVVQADANREISQLAWYYGTALIGIPQIHAGTYEILGLANIYAWAAYTIYDDFLDEEGQPVMLATANFSMRSMVRLYHGALPDSDVFQAFVERVLCIVDEANTLETTTLRFAVSDTIITIDRLPDFGECAILADRALFHVLGPMGVLAATGVVAGDMAWDKTLAAFRHYLIARQLNDDIHDWVKDLRAGQATYVVVELLRYLNVTPGCYAYNELLPYARQQFWQHVLPQVCETGMAHISAARQLLGDALPLSDNNRVTDLFNYVEDSMRAAKALRIRSRDMLVGLNFM